MTDYNKDQHLYIIWAGSNDYLEGRADADYATTNTVNDIQSQIEWLVYYGAKNLLIMGVPDLGVVPEITEQGTSVSEAASKLSNMHNTKLETMVKQEQLDHPEANIVYGNVNSYFQNIIAHPEDYHLKNVKEACFGGTYSYALRKGMINAQEADAAKKAHLDVLRNTDLRAAYVTSRLAAMGEESCANPDEYLFWDHVHPTRIVHKIISTLILSGLGEMTSKH